MTIAAQSPASVESPVKTRVAIVEDHPIYAEALRTSVSGSPDVEVIGVFGSLREFPLDLEPGAIVLLDLGLPGVRGAQAVAHLVGRGFTPLVISADGEREDVLNAIAAGARGYLTKHATVEQILDALRLVAAGHTYISPTLASFVLTGERTGRTSSSSLTDREREVLILVAAGETDQDIADQLRLSVRTVRSYLERVREKTGQRRRPDLTRYAIAEGLLTARSPTGSRSSGTWRS